MKRMKAALAAWVCACLCVALAGIVPAYAESGDAVRVVPVAAKDLEQPGYDPGPGKSQASIVADGANAFAFRLSAALAEKTGDRNFVCSPYSVWIPLAALVGAVDEPYKAELLAALGAAGIDGETMNLAASRMLYDLTNQDSKIMARDYGGEFYHDPLKIANAVFVGHDVTLKQDFARMYMDSYRSTSMNVDFGAPDAADIINGWASENTDGLIDDIVQGFSPNTVAAIANAIYFSDRWDWEFDPDKTAEDVFHAPGGDATALYMLREGKRLLYYEDHKVQAMPLAFKTGGGLLILLPKDGDAAGLLSSMTNEYFLLAARGAWEAPGKLLLPRFSIDSGVMELGGTLAALGIPLFDQGAAPLTELIEEDIPIWLSSALHKATIEVDEKGTTAAAVTVMAMAGSAPDEPDPSAPFEMICDRPFVFVLYGHTYDGGNQVLFTGIVNQP